MFRLIKVSAVLIPVFAVFLIISCTTTVNTAAVSAAGKTYTKHEDPVIRITKTYSEATLRKSLVQFHELLGSFDYFDQFTWGDYIFEDYLTVIYGLENSHFSTGEGSEISIYDKNGKIREKIIRTVIEKNSEGEIWWQTEHSRKGEDTVFYEVLVNRYFVPVTVRFRNSETGGLLSRDTMFGESVRDAMLNISEEEIKSKLDEEREDYAVQNLPSIYSRIKNSGSEVITAGGRKIETVHYIGELPSDEGPGTVDIWYSPDIPQGIVRINVNNETAAEISAWIKGAE